MRTFPINNFSKLHVAPTEIMGRDAFALFEDMVNGTVTKNVLGACCEIVAYATIEVTVKDSTPTPVEIIWPIVVGDVAQIVFHPNTHTHAWVQECMRLKKFADEVNLSEMKAASRDQVISAIKQIDPSNLVASALTLMPLAQKMQRGLPVTVNVVNLSEAAPVSHDMMDYLKRRFIGRFSTSLSVIEPSTLMEPSVVAELTPIITKFTKSGSDKRSDEVGATPNQLLGGIFGK